MNSMAINLRRAGMILPWILLTATSFAAYFTPAFDLADGPLTIQVEMTRNSAIEGSEVNVLFGKEFASGTHALPATDGYLLIHDWNSVNSIDLVHEVRILQ